LITGIIYNQSLRNEFSILNFYKKWIRRIIIDLLDLIKDENDSIPVFNKDCKFLSNDTKHLTQSGAILFGQKVKPQLEKIFNETNYTRP
jgi:hypothetical protein